MNVPTQVTASQATSTQATPTQGYIQPPQDSLSRRAEFLRNVRARVDNMPSAISSSSMTSPAGASHRERSRAVEFSSPRTRTAWGEDIPAQNSPPSRRPHESDSPPPLEDIRAFPPLPRAAPPPRAASPLRQDFAGFRDSEQSSIWTGVFAAGAFIIGRYLWDQAWK